MARTRYIMNSRMLNTITNKHGMALCHKCEKEIRIGDQVISKHVGRVSNYKIYHINCAKKINIF